MQAGITGSDVPNLLITDTLCKRARAIKEKALDPQHPSFATSLNNLARLYQAQGPLRPNFRWKFTTFFYLFFMAETLEFKNPGVLETVWLCCLDLWVRFGRISRSPTGENPN